MPYSTDHAGASLVEILRRHGVEVVFGVAGGQTAAVYDGIAQRSDIRHVAVRDERTAAYAADAYARLTGRVGVCDATVGPGTAKLPSGLGEALNSSIPILALVSELPLSTEARRYRGATSQALDQEALLAPVTKWVGTVRRPEDLLVMSRRAFREATTGRPGPVALVLAQDILDGPGPAIGPGGDVSRFGHFPSMRIGPERGDVAATASVVRRARRPLLVLGGGALQSGAGTVASRLARQRGWAVATTLSGRDCIEADHPLSVGVLGNLGAASAERAAHEADLLILVGTKFGSATTLGWKLPLAHQSFVQVDVDPVELGRDHSPEAVMLADALVGLEALESELDSGEGGAVEDEWPVTIGEARGDWERQRAEEASSDAVPIAPQRVMTELSGLVDSSDVVIADASLSSGWVGSYLHSDARTLFPRGLAGLGWAIPAAIGAAESGAIRRVVAVMGDGAAAYGIGELSTIRENGHPVKMIVLNNRSLGWIRWYRRVSFGRGWEEPDSPETDFAAIAGAYGIPAVRVDDPADLAAEIKTVLAQSGPGLIEVISAVWETPIASHRRAVDEGGEAGYGS